MRATCYSLYADRSPPDLPRKDTGQTLVGDTQASPGLASSSHGGAERAGLSYSVLRHYETH